MKKKQKTTQAERLLETIKKVKAGQGGDNFARTMGKVSLARNARKTSKGQIGG